MRGFGSQSRVRNNTSCIHNRQLEQPGKGCDLYGIPDPLLHSTFRYPLENLFADCKLRIARRGLLLVRVAAVDSVSFRYLHPRGVRVAADAKKCFYSGPYFTMSGVYLGWGGYGCGL